MNITVSENNVIFLSADEIAAFARTKSAVAKSAFGFVPYARSQSIRGCEPVYAEASVPIEADGFTFVINGYVDLAIKSSRTQLEFIKKMPRRLRGITPLTDPHFAASALIKAYLYCENEQCDGAEIIITYYNENSGESTSFSTVMKRPELELLFNALWRRACPFAKHAANSALIGKRQFSAMRFPYPTVRDAQRELIQESFRAIAKKRRLVISAPTGTGKTVSVLYSSLKAIGAGYADKIFYLTAKASTARAASDAAELIARSCPALRVVIVYAKERLCPEASREKSACAVFCPRLDEINGISYEQRRDEALLELFKYPVADASLLKTIANKYHLCPYELSLDLSEYAHMIICDYNYVFDEKIRFKRYFADGALLRKYIFAIDEAHNLPSRVRSTYSSSVSRSELAKLRDTVKEAFQDDRELEEISSELLTALDSVAAAVKNNYDESNDICAVLSELPKELISAAARARGTIGRRIRTDGEYAESFLKDAYSMLGKLLVSASAFSDSFRILVSHTDSDMQLRLLLLDPAKLISSSLALSEACILFSATLSPVSYFAAQFGIGDTEILELPSPYENDNLAIVAYDGISTRFADRSRTATETAEVIAAVTDAREGNYLVYFPSYEYMKRVYRVYREIAPYSRIVCQKSAMNLKERDRFLSMFTSDSEPTVGFCVLGGIFSEGIDLAGERLIGSIIVGIGMGALSSEDNLLKEYYGDEGTEFAYIYPGINRVLQAAGRVIRSENDHGVIILIDDRYKDPAIQKLLPKHWKHMKLVGNTDALSEVLDRFWNKQ